ncbi:hypothetical protein ACF3NA_02470 [Alkanindiges sp. WGS2144]|uniref:hypothetical protein n=1 Tax=Alkanindiges sp. WGS2144 TaxID=3366808 RepID=UPI0037538244
MLEEIQRLQTLIQKLTSQLQLLQDQNRQLHTELDAKPKTVEDPAVREALELTSVRNQELEQELTEFQQRYMNLQTDATALAERYGRLEQNAGELKNRFEALLGMRDQLKAERDKLAEENQQLMQSSQVLIKERDALITKNEHAKQKVEAIIERLASLGQGLNPAQANQDIAALDHPAQEDEANDGSNPA